MPVLLQRMVGEPVISTDVKLAKPTYAVRDALHQNPFTPTPLPSKVEN